MKRWWQFAGLLLLLIAGGGAGWIWREVRREQRFMPQIKTAASRYGVDPMLVRAVVWRESRFQANVRGTRGELGLMQVQDMAAHEWANTERILGFDHERCLDPGTNTLVGTFYLQKLLKRYSRTDDPLPYALADYNAGRSNVLRWNSAAAATNSAEFIRQIGFPGTRNYIRSIVRRYALYRSLARLGW